MARRYKAHYAGGSRDHAEQKGIQKGMQQGAVEEKLEIARKLLKRNRPIDEIAEDTGLTSEDVENLCKEIDQHLRTGGGVLVRLR